MKFEIIAGKEYTADFVVKQNGASIGLVLDPTDTGKFSIVKNGVEPCYVLEDIPMVITDANNGKFTLTLTATETKLLTQKVGREEDGYPSMATYKGLAIFETVAQGTMTAYIERIYVVELGEACQTP